MAQSAEVTVDQVSRPHRFMVTETPQGSWLAREAQGQIARIFATRRAAIHLALYETGTRRAAVLLTPSG